MAQPQKIVIVAAALLTFSASGQAVNEHHVKAAYVFNMARFVEWPAEAFRSAGEPMILCVAGVTPVRSILGEAVRGETIDGRKLEVRQLADIAHASGCHVVFIAASEHHRLPSLLRELSAPGVLTIGETEDFLRQGGAVNFRLEDNKVRIEINLSAVTERKLRVSPTLLSLVRVVRR